MLASVACFILPLFLITPERFSHWMSVAAAAEDMGIGMFVLSFPFGLLFMLAAVFIFYALAPHPHNLPVSFYVLLWFGFFVGGYLQWFHLVPHIFNRQPDSLTTLGLSEIEAPKTNRKRRRRRAHKPSQPLLESKPVLQFEGARRTPLERVISDN